jgi:hypothetical protein
MKKKIFFVGKEVDPNGLYNPKPSNNSSITINENTGSNITQSRPFAQSVRGNSTLVTQQSVAGPMKSTKTLADNRRGNLKSSISSFSMLLSHFSDS